MTVDSRYEKEFEALFARQGIKSATWEHVQTFEELPAYSRYDELGFMTGLSLSDMNRQLIKASVCILERIVGSRSGSGDARTPQRFPLWYLSLTGIYLMRAVAACATMEVLAILFHIFMLPISTTAG